MKRILACLILLCLCLSLIPGEALALETPSGSCGDGVTWKLEDGTLTISGTGAMEFNSQPWFLYQQGIEYIVVEEGVTSIAPHAFSGCWPLDAVSLPAGLTSIGEGAFSGSGLKEISLPTSLTSIGKNAFSFCSELEEITIPNKISALEDSTFAGCHKLTTVNLPPMLVSIGNNVFSGCGMTSFVLPASVSSVGNQAFAQCEALTDTTLSENLTSLGDYVFSGCISLEAISLPDKLTSVSEGAFHQCLMLKAVALPEKLETISDFAFSDCPSLEAVEIPMGTKTIGENAFADCIALEQVKLPTSLTEIGTKAFIGCTALTNVDIPQGIAYLAPSTFEGCSALAEITLPTSLTEIGSRVFYGCALEKVVIPKNVTKLGEASFQNNAALHTVHLPLAINRILGSAFLGCSALADVHYDGTDTDRTNIWVEELNEFLNEANWHYANNAHTHVFVSKVTAPTCTQEGFTTHICDCGESYDDSFVAPLGHDYRDNKCQICNTPMAPITETLSWGLDMNGVLTISGTGAMPNFASSKEAPWYSQRDQIQKVILEPGVTSVGNYGFSGCPNLTEVVLPDGLEKLGFCAFSSCGQLETITLPQTLTYMHKQVFYGCHSLNYMEIPSGITDIRNFTFYGCNSLEMVVLPLSVTTIGEYAFGGCSSLETVNYEGTAADRNKITFSANNQPLLNADWYYSFSYHTHEYIPTVTPPTCASSGYTTYACQCGEEYLADFVPATGAHDFRDGQCTVCQAYGGTLGTDMTWLLDKDGFLTVSGTGAMPNFTATEPAPWAEHAEDILAVVIREGVTTISASAFEGYPNLCDADLPDSLTTIGDKAFANTDLISIYIPKGVTQIGEGAFRPKTNFSFFYVDPENTAFSSVDECLLNKDKTELIQASHYLTGTYLVPESVRIIREEAFANCEYLTAVIFQGNIQSIEADAFRGCSGLVEGFYTGSEEAWAAVDVDDSTIAQLPMTFDHKLGPDVTKYTLIIPSEELGQTSEVWVDGDYYYAEHFEGNAYIQLPDTEATNLNVFTYNKYSEDVHEMYPTGMKVWMLSHDGESYSAKYIPEFDDMLQYAGSSIRIVGKKGIRMITSIPENMKNALTGKGLAGYTLVEYGTALAWVSDLENGPLVLGAEYTKSNYAYKKGVADPVFSRANGKVSYTNVLVGFTNDQCKDDIAMRPYIILKDAKGNQVTIYGGIVCRSIGYIAWQNRTAFQPKTNAYDFVWSIIHHVYGDKYDADYKG